MLNIICIWEKCKFDFFWFWLEDYFEYGGEYFLKIILYMYKMLYFKYEFFYS